MLNFKEKIVDLIASEVDSLNREEIISLIEIR